MTLRDFLGAMFGPENVDDVHVCSRPREMGQTEGWYGRRLGKDTALDPANNNYFCIGLLVTGSPRVLAGVREHRVICCDDVGTKADPVEIEARLGLPAFRVESSPGNESWFYILETPVSVDDDAGHKLVAAVREHIKIAGLSDPGCADAVRYMRLPDGTNTKDEYRGKGVGGEEFPRTKLIYANPTARVDLRVLAESLMGPDWEEIVESESWMSAAVRASLGQLGTGSFTADDRDPWVRLAEAIGLDPRASNKPGVVDADCPFSSEHEVRATTGFGILGGGLMQCHHGPCADRNSRDFQCEMVSQYESLYPDKTASGFLAGCAFEDADKIAGVDEVELAQQIASATEAALGMPPWAAHMNAQYCLVKGISGVVSYTGPDEKEPYTILNTGHFRDLVNGLAQISLPGRKGPPVGLANAWLGSEYPVRYDQIGMWDVGREPRGAMNLFTGLPVRGASGTKCPLFMDFLLNTICSGRLEVCVWIMDWLAWKVQHPLKKPGTLLALIGDQGCGKSFFGNRVRDLFGPKLSIGISQPEHLTGRFSGHLEGKLMVLADEGVWGRDRSAAGVYKALVTETTMMVEHKGQKPREVPNLMALIITSNSAAAVPLEAGGRRETLVRVSNAKKSNKKYFDALEAAWRGGEREAFMGLMETRDVSGFDVWKPLATPDKADAAAEMGGDPVYEWWLEILDGGFCPGALQDPTSGAAPDWDAGPVDVDLNELTGAFRSWAKAAGKHYLPTHQATVRSIRSFCRSMGATHNRRSQGGFIRVATVPVLSTARVEARKAFGG